MVVGACRDDAGELLSKIAFAWVLGRKGSISREPGEDEAAFGARVEHLAQGQRAVGLAF
jgi:hypothetical protein